MSRLGLATHGECDPLVPLEGGVMTADAIPDSSLSVIPKAGHMFFNRDVWQQILDAVIGRLGDTE